MVGRGVGAAACVVGARVGSCALPRAQWRLAASRMLRSTRFGVIVREISRRKEQRPLLLECCAARAGPFKGCHGRGAVDCGRFVPLSLTQWRQAHFGAGTMPNLEGDEQAKPMRTRGRRRDEHVLGRGSP